VIGPTKFVDGDISPIELGLLFHSAEDDGSCVVILVVKSNSKDKGYLTIKLSKDAEIELPPCIRTFNVWG
jgi:hypothetical protein